MKLHVNETDQYFAINLTAETVEEAAFLVRLGVHGTSRFDVRTFAGRGFAIECFANISKHKRTGPEVPKRK